MRAYMADLCDCLARNCCTKLLIHPGVQMRAYMADLCDCLAHKSAIVEELEESLADLRDERASSARQMARVSCEL